MVLFVFILLLSLPIFLSFLIQRYKTLQSCSLPGPLPLPLIGNLHQFDSSNPQLYLYNLSKQYGPLISLRLGFVPTLVVSSAKMAKEILKTHDLQCCNRRITMGQQLISYNGKDVAFSPYNDYWREIRKICAVHLFNSNKAHNFRPVRENEISGLIEKIAELSSVASSKSINLSEMMMFVTNNISYKVAFGKSCGDDRRFHSLLNESQTMLGGFFFSDYFPFLGWLDKFTGMISRLQKNFKDFDAFYQEIIEEHSHPMRSKSVQEEDIIDVFLQIRKERGFKVDLTWDNIKAVLKNVFLGGTDTVAASVVWAMTYLMKNRKTLKKAQEEIRSLIGKKGFVDEDDIQKLPYLKAVVTETMRLQPTVPLIPRETIEKFIIDGYEIPGKTLLFINVWAIGRDPEAWDNLDEFNPERFIGSSIDFKGQHYELIPFGAGRRICPGMHMGIATVELALANLLYKFDWEMPIGMKNEDLDFDSLSGITMHKKNALRLVAKNYV